MSIPGFTAEQSLVPSSVEYHYPLSSTGAGVSPEFLDFIKEAFESVASGIEDAAKAAADGLKKAFDALNSGGGGGGSFTCNNVVTGLFRCNGTQPLLSIAQMTNNCLQKAAEAESPLAGAACAAIAAALYPLLNEYCKSPGGKSQAALINQVCAGS
jgi:hypothetical protein